MSGLLRFGAFIAMWVGAVLVLAELRWFRSTSLVQRIRPHVRSGAALAPRGGVLSVESLRDLAAPLATSAAARLTRALGLRDDLDVVLRRIGSSADPAALRLAQFAQSGAALVGVGALVSLSGAPTALVVAAPPAAAALVFLLIEQRYAHRSAVMQRRIRLELPVVVEQLGMLLGSGHSLGSAVARIGARGHGECARGFREVTRRTRHGLDEVAALREFAELAAVPALDRLVSVLALNREASDLGALIANEARLSRREVHRDLIELLERRGQTVWIPVTVATLLPGVIFMAVPFVDAMRQITGT